MNDIYLPQTQSTIRWRDWLRSSYVYEILPHAVNVKQEATKLYHM